MNFLRKLFLETPSERFYPMTAKMLGHLLAAACIAGVLTWMLSLAIDHVLLGAVFCRDNAVTTYMCINRTTLSGHIAIILSAIILVPVVAILRIKRPLLVVAVATVALWGVSVWTTGNWLVSLLLSTALFVLVFAAVGWINRLKSNVAVIIVLLLFALAARLILLV